MSRSTQVVGLNNRAMVWLIKNNKMVSGKCDCPDCKTEHMKKSAWEVYDKKTGVELGMFDDGPELCKYKLKDNSWVYEYVQDAPWASGPVIFLALRWEDGTPVKESVWKKSEISKYL